VKRPRSVAARRTIDLWRAAPRRARVHTTIRWWTAPFEALESQVPRSGQVLEVGCGHGVFSMFLALSSPDRTVVGIDIDGDKVALAQEVLRGGRSDDALPTIEHRDAGDLPMADGGWSAIVFADVLYLLPREDRERLIADCIAALAPGGVLVIKEVDTRPRFKAWLAQFQEFLATKVLRITRGEALDFPSAVDLQRQLSEAGLRVRVTRLDKGYVHPHCVVVGTDPRT